MKYYKTLIIIILLSLFTVSLSAQNRNFGVPNLLKYDNQLFHFGFLIGYNQFDFDIRSKADLSQYDSLMVINTAALSGFNLGIVTNLRLGKYFDLRFIPGLSFGDRVVNYTILYPDQSRLITKKNIESVYLDLPLLVKLKSSRMHNIRAYVVAGAQYSLDLISAAKKQNNNPREIMLKLYPHDVQAQVGVGIDFYCAHFKFSTEFKMSFGLMNLIVPENNIYAESVQSLKSKMMQISFLFE
ncbi:MAG: porin family protein [Bacteroidales bacterium]|nr:porin family protein [Bacteroidales bacterium]